MKGRVKGLIYSSVAVYKKVGANWIEVCTTRLSSGQQRRSLTNCCVESYFTVGLRSQLRQGYVGLDVGAGGRWRLTNCCVESYFTVGLRSQLRQGYVGLDVGAGGRWRLGEGGGMTFFCHPAASVQPQRTAE